MTLAPNGPLVPTERPVDPAGGERTPAAPQGVAAPGGATGHQFRLAMVAVVVVAGAIQAVLLGATAGSGLSAAARFDAAQARLLVAGAWFADPSIAPLGSHHLVPTVANSPLTPLVLAGADVAGLATPSWHRALFALVFVVAVAVLGLAVRDLAGPRAGVLAALLAAVFPPLFVSPATLGSDTLVVATVALVLYSVARFWGDPRTPRGALLGFSLALAALARVDLVLLVPLVGLPIVFAVRGPATAERLRCLGAVLAVFALCVAPWAARGIGLFSVSGAVSAPLAQVVAGANCPATTGGALVGWWSESCVGRPGTTLASERDAIATNRRAATTYVTAHPATAVSTAAARLGRALGVFRPFQTARLATAEGRPLWASRVGAVTLWLLVPLAVVGALVGRRRRVPLFPFVGLVIVSLLGVTLGYGAPRYMLPAEVAFVALGGVALHAGLGVLGRLTAAPTGAHRAGAGGALPAPAGTTGPGGGAS